MSYLPTVKIKNPNEEGGYIIINESDFDESLHELFEISEKSNSETDSDENDFSTFTKAQLLAHAQSLGLNVDNSMKKSEIIEAITAKE